MSTIESRRKKILLRTGTSSPFHRARPEFSKELDRRLTQDLTGTQAPTKAQLAKITDAELEMRMRDLEVLHPRLFYPIHDGRTADARLDDANNRAAVKPTRPNRHPDPQKIEMTSEVFAWFQTLTASEKWDYAEGLIKPPAALSRTATAETEPKKAQADQKRVEVREEDGDDDVVQAFIRDTLTRAGFSMDGDNA